MKTINVEYGTDGKILSISENSLYFEQESKSLTISAALPEEFDSYDVRAYLRDAKNNSAVTEKITKTNGRYDVVVSGEYMSKGTLYAGYELYNADGYIQRLEIIKIAVDSWITLGKGTGGNVYVVTVNVGDVKTLSPGEDAYVTNSGTQKDMILNFGIPQGIKGDKGDKGDTGERGIQGEKGDTGAAFTYDMFTAEQLALLKGEKGDKGDKGDTGAQGIQGEKGDIGASGYSPIKGTDYWTADDKAEIIDEVSADINAHIDDTDNPHGVTKAQLGLENVDNTSDVNKPISTAVQTALDGKADKTEVTENDNALKLAITSLKAKSIPHTTSSGYTISVTDHLNEEQVIDYKIYGNSVQDGTPSTDSPVEIQSVGDLVTDTASEHYGKYEVPITVCGKNLYSRSSYVAIDKVNTTIKTTYTPLDSPWVQGGIKIALSGTIFLSNNDTRTNPKTSLTIIYEDGSLYRVYLSEITKGVECNLSNVVTLPTEKKIKQLDLRIIDYSTNSGGVWDGYVKNIQLELSDAVTEYEPYQEPVIEHIYLDEPLRKIGDCADYIDYKNQNVVRQIEVLDDTGTKTIDESLGVLDTPTTEVITVPDLITPDSGAANIFASTSTQPSGMDVTYYQDINKIITELKNAILAQGGNV